MHSRLVAGTLTLSLVLAPLAAMAEPAPPPATPIVVAQAADEALLPDDDPMLQAEMQQRQRREAQLTWHQGFALASLVAMVTTGVIGFVMANQKATSPDISGIRTAHAISGATTTVLYGTAATLALTAPPPTNAALGGGGFDPITVHRGLTWLHAGTLGATVALGLASLFQVPGLTDAHKVLGITTTSLMAISGGLIVFNF